MADTPDTRLGLGRRFAIEIALGGFALAALLWWRGSRSIAPAILSAVSALVLMTGLLRPSLLAPIAERWLGVGARIARVTTPIFLTVIYLVVVTPFGVVRRRLGRSPMRRDRSATTFWVVRERPSAADTRAAMEHQF